MIIREGDTQEVPEVGTFVWDGDGFWVLGKVKHSHGIMYLMLENLGLKFDVQSSHKEPE